MQSPFLLISPDDWIASNEVAFAIYDRYPVSPGHSLVVTRREVATWFDASKTEQSGLMALVNVVKERLDQTLNPQPDGYNVGFNAGNAAGQTVPHLHIHVIPRYHGDMDDPRGGVRHVIPEKGNYLVTPNEIQDDDDDAGVQLSVGHPNSPLWEHLSWRLTVAQRVDILASFVQLSGLDVIEQRLFDAIRNHARVRILVSDYLTISDPRALHRLLGWCELATEDFDEERLMVKLVEMDKLPANPASFHPKAWRIDDDHHGFISVGSSNLSKAALQTGVEWNLLSTRKAQPESHTQVANEFEAIWTVASPLTSELVKQYERRAAKHRAEHFEPEAKDSPDTPLAPRPWQEEALKALQELRVAGYQRALVAVATGMGKTWLAAFDVRQVGDSLNRRPRVLIIAHRAHILAQAEAAVSRVLDASFPDGVTSWYIGSRSQLDGELVIASIQKLSRAEGLSRIAEEQFDYVVVDEVHHAHAPSYRRVLSQLNADFMLGLTATPERTDGYDVATIFDDNLAYHASIGDGIADDSLVPFHYIGIKDTVDFRQIPWRNGKFDVAELEQRVENSERMQRLWETLQSHPAQRTLVFCCSRRHALFARNWLRAAGMSSAAVFSGQGGDSYSDSLAGLRSGRLQSMCVVDMFNEGLDIPDIDRVVMLRPTESKIVFLQQLGRGLRASDGKSRLLVIDFVGNHRIFAQRILHLLSLRGSQDGWRTLKKWLTGTPPELPEGCLLDVELDAQDMLKEFLPKGKTAAIEGYRGIRDELGRRPTMLEVFTRGFLPRAISSADGSWFAFANSEGDLNVDEQQVVDKLGDWLKMLETTNLNKSYKMIVLRVLLDQNNLFDGVDVDQFAANCRKYLRNHQILRRDLEGEKHGVDHQNADDETWAKWWIKWPIERWLKPQSGNTWFVLEESQFKLNFNCPEQQKHWFESMTEEIVDWRLAAYAKSRRLTRTESKATTFTAKVSHSKGRRILFVPDTSKAPGRPVGPTNVRLSNGEVWEFKFVKVACNVAKRLGDKENQLSSLLQDWFGPDAGLPGTGFTVQFEMKDGEWIAIPEQIEHVSSVKQVSQRSPNTTEIQDTVDPGEQYTTHAPVYDLFAAAGDWGTQGTPREIAWIAAPNHRLEKGMFAAKVTGQSMEPRIPDGSWCLFRPCPAGSRQGRLLLVQVNTHLDPEDGGRYTVKRYHSTKNIDQEGWSHTTIELQPLNQDYQPIPITEGDAESIRVVGEFVAVLDDQYADSNHTEQ